MLVIKKCRLASLKEHRTSLKTYSKNVHLYSDENSELRSSLLGIEFRQGQIEQLLPADHASVPVDHTHTFYPPE